MPDALSRLLGHVRPRGVLLSLTDAADVVRLGGDSAAPLSAAVPLTGSAVLGSDAVGSMRVDAGEVALATTRSPVTVWPGAAGPLQVLAVSYAVEGSVCDRVLDGLPPLITARATPERTVLLAQLAAEVRDGRPGGDAVVDRLTDLVVVTALRDWMATPGNPAPAWVIAQEDQVVGAALRLMHDALIVPGRSRAWPQPWACRGRRSRSDSPTCSASRR